MPETRTLFQCTAEPRSLQAVWQVCGALHLTLPIPQHHIRLATSSTVAYLRLLVTRRLKISGLSSIAIPRTFPRADQRFTLAAMLGGTFEHQCLLQVSFHHSVMKVVYCWMAVMSTT